MASRIERCGRCNQQLLVPIQAVTVRCSVCQAITRFQQDDSAVVHGPGPARFNSINSRPAGSGCAYPGSARPYNQAHTDYMNKTAPDGCGNNGYYNYYDDGSRPPPVHRQPSAFGRKRALLCGISYNDTGYSLSGSVNDVKRMRFLLVEKLGFPSDCVLVLTEEELNLRRIPTKENIRAALRWLVQDCQAGDSLLFHYSGHGSRQKDYNNDELDRIDETLCPVDFETEGPTIDDEINATIVRPLPRGAMLHAIIDTCYSATVLDLPFVCRINNEGYYMWEDQRRPTAYKGTSGGLALSISACDDHQTSASTTTFISREVAGAMTSSFIHVVQNEPGLTYGRLLNAMRIAIPSLIRDTKASQEPQLSSSQKFDIYSKQFML